MTTSETGHRSEPVPRPDAARTRSALLARFEATRTFSTALTATFTPVECDIQSMPDASPTRWHLAHTTWFFETFVLRETPGYTPFDASYEALFNSYYNAVGEQPRRDRRGARAHPDLATVGAYRAHVDGAVRALFERGVIDDRRAEIVELGIQHEQQHQELIVTDITHARWQRRRVPTGSRTPSPVPPPREQTWVAGREGIARIGHAAKGFSFDNERPRHRVFLEPYEIATRTVTNGEYRAFIADGGYRRPELWLSLGWDTVRSERWCAPLYWSEDAACEFTPAGWIPLEDAAPVCHVSYFEADAFARWSGARLPTEFEWEDAVSSHEQRGGQSWSTHLHRAGLPIHPCADAADDGPLEHALGNVWEWTSSHYSPYPGYEPAAGALGEYNGKFMCSQFVLRGGSCATPAGHARPSYRNFFPPSTRWQFSGIRLAR